MGLTDATVLAALAIALSFVIERVLELLKSIYDLLDARLELHHFWTRRAIAIRDFVQRRMRALEYVDPSAIAQFLQRVDDLLLGPGHGYSGTIPTICGDLVRAGAVRIAAKLVGATIGIVIAFSLDLDLFKAFDQALSANGLGELVTGVAMGFGAGPIHKLVVALDERRAKSAQPGPANA
jgi:hypothetical protein